MTGRPVDKPALVRDLSPELLRVPVLEGFPSGISLSAFVPAHVIAD